jgi:glycosyltransferase involved in cell wall biosynthesis
MIDQHRVLVVMPAYKAGKTLAQTVAALPPKVVDEILVVDDASSDDTVAQARALGLNVKVHAQNRGYGGNQKTCYATALATDADIIIMLHPDYQYEPKLVTAMGAMVASGVYDMVLGSRILGGGALKGGMPMWKYVANRILTAFENLLLGAKLSEYHTGYRAYHRRVLEALPFEQFSDDFVFDNQFIVYALAQQFRVGEITCPTKYFEDASSINFSRSVQYGLGVVVTSVLGAAQRFGVRKGFMAHPPKHAPGD